MTSRLPARTLLRAAPLAIALALADPHVALALDSAPAPAPAATPAAVPAAAPATPAGAPAAADPTLAATDPASTDIEPSDGPGTPKEESALPTISDVDADPVPAAPAAPAVPAADPASEKSPAAPAAEAVPAAQSAPATQPASAAQPAPAAKAEVAEATQPSYSNMYRLYNPFAGDHHYTLSAAERDHLVSVGWRYEGIGWYSDATSASLAVLRQYNPYATTGTHNFTTSGAEDASLRTAGWRAEGEAWRASRHAQLKIDGFWLVTSSWGSLERYWVGSDAALARNRVVEASEGAGFTAYATGTGAVVRGALDRGDGWAWLANGDGRLAAGDGWVITDAFGHGTQRYYLGARGDWSLARVGEFVVDGLRYFGRGEYGFELRNDAVWLGSWLWANNDGVLSGASALLSTLLDAAHWTPATPGGYCAAWVENVVANAGLGDFMGNACDLYDWYCASGSLSDIRPGMIVAVSSHPHTEAGSIFGHVGIYVGNGSIRDSVYGYVREMRLSEWVAYYGASVQPRWGWLGGVAAC